MYRDPIVEEVRRVRAQIYREYKGDEQKLLAAWKKIEREFSDRVVDLSDSKTLNRFARKPKKHNNADKKVRTRSKQTPVAHGRS